MSSEAYLASPYYHLTYYDSERRLESPKNIWNATVTWGLPWATYGIGDQSSGCFKFLYCSWPHCYWSSFKKCTSER